MPWPSLHTPSVMVENIFHNLGYLIGKTINLQIVFLPFFVLSHPVKKPICTYEATQKRFMWEC